MAKQKPLTDRGPVDLDDDDRRALAGALDREYAAGRLAPQADTEPSAVHDEHRGLAARILDLRRLVEKQEQQRASDLAELRRNFAQVEQQVNSLQKQVDEAMGQIRRKGLDLDEQLRQSAEQVRAAGELARKMTDHMKTLDDLREMAADPHEVVKPLRKDIGELKHGLETLQLQVDRRFEALPKVRARALEERD